MRWFRLESVLIAALLGAAISGTAVAATVRPASSRAVRTPLAWGRPIVIDGNNGSPNGLTGVSCPTASFCASVDGAGRALTFDGLHWSRPRNVDTDPTGLTAVSCPTRNWCMATDTNGFEITYNGKRWSSPRSFDPSGPPEELGLAISCPTTKFCAAVDDLGTALVWHGHKWARHVIKDKFGNALGLTAVSCPSSSFCMAVDNSGDAVAWNGAKWLAPRTADSNGELLAVSCVSTKFCAAAGDGTVIYNGKRWLPSDSISSVAVGSVSCVTPRDCFAGDNLGNAYRWNGKRWLPPAELRSDDSLDSISCPSARFCSTVTAGGATVFYAPVPEVATRALPAATVGNRYSVRLTGAGGSRPYSWSRVSRLPQGLALSAGGVISGVPKAAGHHTITIAVTDPLREHTRRALSLTIRS